MVSADALHTQRETARYIFEDKDAHYVFTARARRLIWADLMKRAFAADVLVCPRCGGEMRLVAVIEDPAVIEKILTYLRLWQRGPPPGRHVVVDPADREPSYIG